MIRQCVFVRLLKRGESPWSASPSCRGSPCSGQQQHGGGFPGPSADQRRCWAPLGVCPGEGGRCKRGLLRPPLGAALGSRRQPRDGPAGIISGRNERRWASPEGRPQGPAAAAERAGETEGEREGEGGSPAIRHYLTVKASALGSSSILTSCLLGKEKKKNTHVAIFNPSATILSLNIYTYLTVNRQSG